MLLYTEKKTFFLLFFFSMTSFNTTNSSNHNLSLSTPLCRLLNIRHPILLAGMFKSSGPQLAAAVSNAGGLGVIGGAGLSPRILRLTIKHLKRHLTDSNRPFGVDLLLPKVGDTARKTNYDYTKGRLNELIDIIIESRAKLFVCAVGVPPKWVVEKLHAAGVMVMNMVGAPKHVGKAIAQGVDVICAQGGEGGGHTGILSALTVHTHADSFTLSLLTSQAPSPLPC